MKKFMIAGTVLLCAGVILFSCSKKSSEGGSSTPVTESVVAKWLVQGADTAMFKSFEFTQGGQYIVVMPFDFAYGDFTKTGSNITLKNFGTIVLKTLTSTSCKFDLTTPKSGKTTYSLNTVKANEMPNSGKTTILCHTTWHLDSLNSMPTGGTTYDDDVLFTPAGTYFVHYNYSGDNADALWQWKNTAQDTLCYSWSGSIYCGGMNECAIHTLTNSKLVMSEVSGSFFYVLTPKTSKSAFTGTLIKPEDPHTLLGK